VYRWWINRFGANRKHSTAKSLRVRNDAITAGGSVWYTAVGEHRNYDFGIPHTKRDHGFTAAVGNAPRRKLLDGPGDVSTRKIFGRRREYDQPQGLHAISSRLVILETSISFFFICQYAMRCFQVKELVSETRFPIGYSICSVQI